MSKEKILTFPDFLRTKMILWWGTWATVAFVGVYGWCNKAALAAPEHYRLYMDWELSIPLLPWMIFPYISLNLLFVVCAFVLKTPQSIKGFCISLIYGALVAGLFFYFFPGKLGYVRSPVQEFSDFYDFMFSIDHPHNLFPSLHVTYSGLAIFAMRDQTRSKAFHVFLLSWLVLICASVVLVHQHHLFDIFSGAVLGTAVYRLVYKKYSPES